MEERVRRLAECFQRVLGDEVQALGRELGLRNRKLTVAEFVATLVLGWWENPRATRDELAIRAQEWFGVEVTTQALSERLTGRVAELLRRLLDRLCAQAVGGEPTALPILERFSGVFLDDCTTIALPDELHEEFPGCGNQVAGAAQAALKMLVRLEVLSGALVSVHPAAGREGDVALGRATAVPPPGSLLLRDRGFFEIAELRRLEQAQVWWLTRLPTGITLRTSREGPRQSLADFLRWQSEPHIEQQVWLADGAFPCRLIACRCAPDVVERRKRRLHETSKRKGRTPSQQQLLLCEWFVLATNIPAQQLTLEEALVVYRVRWQIELVFKCYKSEAGLLLSRARLPVSRMVELWAKWVGRVLEHWVLLQLGGPLALRSWRVRLRRLRRYVPQLASSLRRSTITCTKTLAAILTALARIPPKRTRRKRPGTRELLWNPKLVHTTLS